jgi:signal transduction histidine kinase
LQAPHTLLAHADSDQIRQALQNLLNNGLQAAAPGDVVLVKVYGRDHTACVDVENPGTPIPDRERARIFEPFFTTKPGCTGLGLSIARKIARVHGGDLELMSNVPQRICFSLTLPIPESFSESDSPVNAAFPVGG